MPASAKPRPGTASSFLFLGPGEKAERLGEAETPPEAPRRNPQEREPEQQAGAGLREKQDQGKEVPEGTAKAAYGSVAKLDQGGRHGGIELGLVFLGEFELDAGEVHAVLQVFLFRFHLLDFTPYAGDLLLDFKNIFDLAGARSQDVLEAKFRLSVIFDAGGEIRVLLSDLFTVLAFPVDPAKGL